MNKIINIILFFLFMMFIDVSAQELTIDSIKVSRIITELKNNRGEHENNGPLVNLFIEIKNKTNLPIILYPSKSIIKIKYRCRNRLYEITVNPLSLLPFIEKEKLSIAEGEHIKLNFSDWIFLGTNIIDTGLKKTYDYSEDILQALPTLQVIYDDNNCIIESSTIRDVKVSDYKYIY